MECREAFRRTQSGLLLITKSIQSLAMTLLRIATARLGRRTPSHGRPMSTATTEELFSAALLLPASERACFLQRACGDDREQHVQVRCLLDAFSPAAEFVRERLEACPSETAGDFIGDFRLVQELGEGGGGIVYLAEQRTPLKREVALKIIKLGMDTRAVINRFEAERQALAMMDHPNIARVFDAGATPTGRPYFVMELVRGIRITEYSSQCRLTIQERLLLFIQVCNAIEHAHQKGLVHRDIKPSNVLVTLHGGTALAKVIDFGVAKATQGRLTEETLFTLVDQFIGTPAYVSPEQTGFGSAHVDARSDIFSLGALLYELLTGCTPLDGRELSGATLEEVRRRIREEAPALPSKRLHTLNGKRMSKASERYRTSALRLIQLVRGDLDWIVMRCLEKDKARRYRSASDLAADLGRYLQNEPVLARPPSVIYAFRKFAARHRAVFVTVSVAMSALLIATGVSTWQAVRATRAERLSLQDRERAEDVSKFMLDVFSAADPFVNFGHEPTARSLLDQAARSIQNDLNQQPDVRARLLEAIGRSYRRMGQPDRAVVYLKDALRIIQESRLDEAGLGSVVTELAIALREDGRIDESDRYFSEAQDRSRRVTDDRSETHALLLVHLGKLEKLRGHTTQALEYVTKALDLMRSLRGGDDPEVGAILAEMSNIMAWADDFAGAERTAREAVRIYRAVPEHHPDRVMADYFLGEILFYRGQIDEAAALYERTLAAQRQIYGSVNSVATDTLAALAQVRLAQKNIVDAEKLVVEALNAHRNSESTAYLRIGYLQTMLATVLMRNAQFADAEDLLRETLELFARHLPPDHQYIASAEHYLGEALLAQKEFGEAETVLTDAMERWKRTDAPAWRPARSASALGEVLHKLGRSQDAERYLVDSYRVLVAESAADQDARQIARQRITRFYTDMGQHRKLDALLLEGTRVNAPPTATNSNSSRTAPDSQG